MTTSFAVLPFDSSSILRISDKRRAFAMAKTSALLHRGAAVYHWHDGFGPTGAPVATWDARGRRQVSSR